MNWATVPAESKSSRVYLVPDSGTNFFGLNEIVLTTKDAKAAGKQVDKIKSNLDGLQEAVAHRNRLQADESHQHWRPEHQDRRLDRGRVAEVDRWAQPSIVSGSFPRDRR